MIKSELVQKIAERYPELYQRDAENVVNAILEEIVQALTRGDRVEIRGFGAFSVKKRDARLGRNPRTGEHVPVVREGRAGVQGRQGNARRSTASRSRPASAAEGPGGLETIGQDENLPESARAGSAGASDHRLRRRQPPGRGRALDPLGWSDQNLPFRRRSSSCCSSPWASASSSAAAPSGSASRGYRRAARLHVREARPAPSWSASARKRPAAEACRPSPPSTERRAGPPSRPDAP